jgi:hypothetical protein
MDTEYKEVKVNFTKEKMEYVAALCEYQSQLNEVLKKLETVSCLRKEGKPLADEVEKLQKAVEQELELYFKGELVLSASEHVELLKFLGAGFKHGSEPFTWATNKDLISFVTRRSGSFTYLDLVTMYNGRPKDRDETPRPHMH